MKINSLSTRAFRTLCLFCMLGLSLFTYVSANNIRIIGKPVLANEDTLKKTIQIKFDIAWDNSWKTTKPENHDAAWIFVKCWDGEAWNHVYLDSAGAIPGSTKATDAVNKDATYYVSDREGKNTKQTMVLEPGYSMAWKQWRMDPDEKSVRCVVGWFLYRKDYGAGHVVVPGVTFKWNYGSQGFVPGDDLVVKVFAVEMVYVPKGAYYLGGKGTAAWQVGSFTTNGATFGTPMVVRGEDSIVVANSAATNTLWAQGNAIVAGVIPGSFPKGYQAFYIMKYEMTQEAYVEFLNTLNQGQQNTRIDNDLNSLTVNGYAYGPYGNAAWLSPTHFRNGIKIKQAAPTVVFGCDMNNNNNYNQTDQICYDGGKDSTGKCLGRTLTRNLDGQDVAMNFVTIFDLLAYAEFSGLRPMTELEYEKACRGPREPVNDEYTWGSVTRVFFSNVHITLDDGLTGTERPRGSYNAGVAGLNWNTYSWWNQQPALWWQNSSFIGPLRVGIFADSTTTRAASGASYWGVMNMSDNVAEMCISVAYAPGRLFVGTHGSGLLDGNGDAVNTDWLKMGTTWQIFIPRGMFFTTNTTYFPVATHPHLLAGMVSSRYRWNHSEVPTTRSYVNNYYGLKGIRCVRTDKAKQ